MSSVLLEDDFSRKELKILVIVRGTIPGDAGEPPMIFTEDEIFGNYYIWSKIKVSVYVSERDR